MTYLDLVNKVLVRLREDQIDASLLDANPYTRSIGAHVNDAKRAVEDSWQWSQLRQMEAVNITQGQVVVALPNSADKIITLKSLLVAQNGNFLRMVPNDRMKYWNANSANQAVQENPPAYYSFYPDDPATGNQQIELFPPSNANYTLEIDRVQHQDELVAADDRLRVPSLPVYALATALASRERGEVGGTPTSELFSMADNYLSDAIAYDSSKFPEELVFFTPERTDRTNVRFA